MDWTEANPEKKKKVIKKKAGPNDQISLMKEMQGFRNWKAKEEKKEDVVNTGRSKLGAGVACDAYIREDFQEKKRERVTIV